MNIINLEIGRQEGSLLIDYLGVILYVDTDLDKMYLNNIENVSIYI